uniref:Major facilitator superfamily associated domain-containing protein n=1 Tax=Lygus hesperus TaxID=30085 RepID=A0A0K8SV11_LYGHE
MKSNFTCEMYCRDGRPFGFDGENHQEVDELFFMMGQMEYSAVQLQDKMVVDVVSLTDRNGKEINTSCPILSKVVCELHCSDIQLQKLINKPAIHEEDAPKLAQFWIYGILVVVGRLATTNAMTIGDTMCLGLLGERSVDYGRQRMFGAGGWGLISSLSGDTHRLVQPREVHN